MRVWLTRDNIYFEGSCLWRVKPLKDSGVWLSRKLGTAHHGLIVSGEEKVKAVTKNFHGCRKGGIVELEIEVKKVE